jgi:putative SOS response-associated peptidase YedK
MRQKHYLQSQNKPISEEYHMCGRYTLVTTIEEIAKHYKAEPVGEWKPKYNIAPTQLVPVVTSENPDGISFFYWGLIPNWSKEKSVSPKLINARAETLAEKVSFKQPLEKRRCLIPADGFYEWKVLGKKTKIPHRITLKNQGLFSFAGLWEEFEDDNEEVRHTFTIITTRANSLISDIHDRMPVILDKNSEKLWLDESISTADHLSLLMPFPSEEMETYTVSSLVNSVLHDHEGLIKPAPPTDQHGNYTLFS